MVMFPKQKALASSISAFVAPSSFKQSKPSCLTLSIKPNLSKTDSPNTQALKASEKSKAFSKA